LLIAQATFRSYQIVIILFLIINTRQRFQQQLIGEVFFGAAARARNIVLCSRPEQYMKERNLKKKKKKS